MDIPHAHSLVHAATRDEVTPRIPCDTKDGAEVPAQDANALLRAVARLMVERAAAAVELPYSHGAVVGSGREQGRVGGEGDVRDAGGVRVERALEVERREAVDVDRTVRSLAGGLVHISVSYQSYAQAEARRVPSGEKARDEMAFLWPWRVNRSANSGGAVGSACVKRCRLGERGASPSVTISSASGKVEGDGEK